MMYLLRSLASISSGSGAAAVSSSLALRADGTYTLSGLGSVRSSSAGTTVTAGGQSRNQGRWTLSGYTLTLTDAGGKIIRGITFPYDDKKTALYPDRLCFAGTMYKKE